MPEDCSLNNPGISRAPHLLLLLPPPGSSSPVLCITKTPPWNDTALNFGIRGEESFWNAKIQPKADFPPFFPQLGWQLSLIWLCIFLFLLINNLSPDGVFKSFSGLGLSHSSQGWMGRFLIEHSWGSQTHLPHSLCPGILGSLLSSWGFLLFSPTWSHPKAPFG